MLLKIEVENFFSVRDRVRIDFRAANINSAKARELSSNVMLWNNTPVLKCIGLFGSNAAGKSNILKAIGFCCRMILESHLHNEGSTFNFVPFKFDGYDKKPSHFLVNFVCDNIEYEYSYTLTRNEILEESLSFYPRGRRAKVFERNGDKYSFGSGYIQKPFDVATNTSRKNLFLSRASSMNRELAQRIYRYFMESFLLGLIQINQETTINNFNKYKPLILKALNICDLDITNIEIRKEQSPAPVIPIYGQSDLSFKMVDILKFKTYHKNNNKLMFDMDMEESDGTKQLFSILMRLLDVVRNKKSLMVDEFDRSLHTRLAEFVIDLIHASECSQLLFTSHNTNLIAMGRFRKDQIVFVSKSEDGVTEAYTLYDFKDFRENMDAEKAYIQGRFDAVPYVDSSVSALKELLK